MSIISVSEHLSALVNVEIQARDKERERIIKLLENCGYKIEHAEGMELALALIKGEQE